MECIENIIGLSDVKCPCFGDPDGNTSDSGYFVIDALETGTVIKVNSALDCGDELWNIIKTARDRSIEDFKINLLGSLSQSHSRVVEWSGTIGVLDKATKIITTPPGIVTLPVNPRNAYQATNMTINAVGLKLADTGTVTVRLFKNGSEVKSWTVDAEAGNVVWVSGSITVPMYENNIPNNYYFQFDLGTMRPYETKTYCCSGPDRWNRYIEMPNRYMNGFAITLSLNCGSEWICSDWNYKEDPWAKVMARVVTLLARVYVYEYILNSGQVNKYTLLLEPEHLMGKIRSLNKQIEERMEYLAQNLPPQAEKCWSCTGGSRMGSIIV